MGLWQEGAPALAFLLIWSLPMFPSAGLSWGQGQAKGDPSLGLGDPRRARSLGPHLTPPYPPLQRAAFTQPRLRTSRPVML